MSKKYDNLGKRIKKLRTLKKFSQKELGKALNIPKQSVSRIEKGNRKITDEELEKLIDFFNVYSRVLLEDGWIEKMYKMPYKLQNKWNINIPLTIDDYIIEIEDQIDYSINSGQIHYLKIFEDDIKNTIKAFQLLLKECKEKTQKIL